MDAESLIHIDHPEDGHTRISARSMLSYGPHVGVPRIVETYRRLGIRQTFFIPAWCIEKYPHTTRVYTISHDQHLAAAYYRNTIIHFFVPMAIAEIALALGFESDEMDEASVLRRAVALRDLLKFEFFFSPTQQFEQEILGEINRYRTGEPEPGGPVVVNVAAMYPAKSPIVLRPFLEAYLVVAEAIALTGNDPIDAENLSKRSLQLGEQMYALGQIRSREAVTTTLYASGIDLARNRGLLDGTHQARIDFRNELQDIRIALNAIDDSA
jgi:glycerol-3-phosphate O-acyltransferase